MARAMDLLCALFLLTILHGGATQSTLSNQTTFTTNQGVPAGYWAPDPYALFIWVDDFDVPAGEVWNITEVQSFGGHANTAPLSYIYNWEALIYVNTGSPGGPGTITWSWQGAPTNGLTNDAPILQFAASSPQLSAGKYWLAVFPDYNLVYNSSVSPSPSQGHLKLFRNKTMGGTYGLPFYGVDYTGALLGDANKLKWFSAPQFGFTDTTDLAFSIRGYRTILTPTTQGLTTKEMTTNALTTKEMTTGIAVTTNELTTNGLTTKELTTKLLTTQALTTKPLTTKELTTNPLTTQELTTEDPSAITSGAITSGLITSGSITSGSITSGLITSGLITSGVDVTTARYTTRAFTTKALTTNELTTQSPTTQPLTTKQLTTNELTTKPLTTQPLTTKPLTTNELTTQPLTTQPLTTQPLTTNELTTQPLTTNELTTQSLTTGETPSADTTGTSTGGPAQRMDITIRFDVDFSAFNQTAVLISICEYIGVPSCDANDIVVKDVWEGSTYIRFELINALQSYWQDFYESVSADSSVFTGLVGYPVLFISVDPVQTSTSGPTPVDDSTDTDGTTSSSSGLSQTDIILLAVLGALVGVALMLIAAAVIRKHHIARKTKKDLERGTEVELKQKDVAPTKKNEVVEKKAAEKKPETESDSDSSSGSSSDDSSSDEESSESSSSRSRSNSASSKSSASSSSSRSTASSGK